MMTRKEVNDFINEHGFWCMRSKKYVTTLEDLHNPEIMIFEDDTPKEMWRNTMDCLPLSEDCYPGVLTRFTAMEAGEWAVSKCKSIGWEISRDNIESCLANLEMDF